MKKPDEMDKTGEECWFNRFFRLSIMLKFKFSKVMIGFTEDDPFKVQDKRVPEPSVSVQAPRGEGEDAIWGTLVAIFTSPAHCCPQTEDCHFMELHRGL